MTGPAGKFAPGEPRPGTRAVPARPRAHPLVLPRADRRDRTDLRAVPQTPSSSPTATGTAAHEFLYRVGFASRSLWPDYDGNGTDRVEIEIYEHWLEPAPGDTT